MGDGGGFIGVFGAEDWRDAVYVPLIGQTACAAIADINKAGHGVAVRIARAPEGLQVQRLQPADVSGFIANTGCPSFSSRISPRFA